MKYALSATSAQLFLMHDSDFEAPPLHWSILSIVGGIATAITLVIGIELSAIRVRSELTDSSNTSTASHQSISTGASQLSD